jgi:protein O-mannosyl-transferase
MKPAGSKRTPPTVKTSPVAAQVAGVCFCLALVVLGVFGQTARFDFVNYDDEENVYQNPVVAQGLSVKAVGWAFTHAQASNWIPLTTLSHMLDCQLFGLNAGGHHLVNVLWQAANAVLLFLLLRQMTGSLWRSAFVAAIFAIHPLRAESVAWVSERKDVLSGFFFILSIGAYVRYARQPSGARYAALLLLFALGLLAKSMVATLPFVLLLLDYWPLGRWREGRPWTGLLREKIPLFALSAASCVAAALVPGLVITGSQRLTLWERAANAVVAYGVYLRQMVFPTRLATLYPISPNGPPIWMVCFCFFLLAAISALVIAWRKRHPWLVAGWFWYLGMLFPVIGLIQISHAAAHADRYTYLPEIGLAIAGTWAVADWSARRERWRAALPGLAAVIIGVLIVCAHQQTSYWRNGETLWTRSLNCTTSNSVAHVYLGAALVRAGKPEMAIEHYRVALEIAPDNVAALNNLGTTLADDSAAAAAKPQVAQAIACFRKAIQIDPASKVSHYNLAVALSSESETAESISEYRKVLAIDPAFIDAHMNLGNALRKSGHLDDAITEYQETVELSPEFAPARSKLAAALSIKGELLGAIAEYGRALELQPDQPDIENNLAWLLATTSKAGLRDGARALLLAEQANQSSGGSNPIILRTLAAAQAESGQFGEAITTARRALTLAMTQKNTDLAANLSKEINLYEAKTPMRDPPR